ncbi:hypothetical protein [Peristeroidobacter agariperforans]|uniref:hypothetical protein n=1 Tax=Peristeroidobacter agariperforans TaxID=268404 RepID=UPI00101BB36D|nr:hypothetical protein [Peristeroidobacter agariperforans]
MTRARQPKGIDASALASVVITVEGCKAIKDADLAALFGLSLAAFYKRVGSKLWMLNKSMHIKLPKRYARGRLDTYPPLAFTHNGVLLIAAVLGDDDSLEIGMEVVHALRNRRRNSARKKRSDRRENDAEKSRHYSEAMARMLQGRLHDMLKKMRH